MGFGYPWAFPRTTSGSLANGPYWCIVDLFTPGNPPASPYQYNECATFDSGPPGLPATYPDDFQTICCDGKVIDSSQDLMGYALTGKSYPLDLANPVCCGESGVLQAGDGNTVVTAQETVIGTTCKAGLKATPLVSLVATNSKVAGAYLAMYESGEERVRTKTPRCLWVQTTWPEVTMVDVRVPAAVVTDAVGNAVTVSLSGSGIGPVTDGPDGTSTSTGGAVESTLSSAGVGLAQTCVSRLRRRYMNT
ncbi:hypothetical protein B0T16DRAFT_457443 [Cercophora newfieldiana]|uniref:Uncharacterized protein n=1 Tax=Cercophora newfieldiana TaxID=92897 RepID=A0AA39Y3K7_9PEZI|nr:hypothetical protein B0T16DRAFT_457443 [Cercophora newfieldiana]